MTLKQIKNRQEELRSDLEIVTHNLQRAVTEITGEFILVESPDEKPLESSGIIGEMEASLRMTNNTIHYLREIVSRLQEFTFDQELQVMPG